MPMKNDADNLDFFMMGFGDGRCARGDAVCDNSIP